MANNLQGKSWTKGKRKQGLDYPRKNRLMADRKEAKNRLNSAKTRVAKEKYRKGTARTDKR